MTAPFSLLADEHVKRAFVTALEANGYDVAIVDADYSAGTSDADLLEFGREDGRVVLTNDTDFVGFARQRDHAGVIVYADQALSPGEIVRGVARIDRHLDEGAMRNHVEWLENWL